MEQTLGGIERGKHLPKIPLQETPEGLRIVDGQGTWMSVLGLGCFALIWNGVAWPMAIVFFLSGDLLPTGLITFIFGGVGILLLVGLVAKIRVVSRFQPGELHLKQWPFYLGSEGRVYFRRGLKGTAEVQKIEAALVCTEVATYTVGTETRTVRERVWESTLPAAEVSSLAHQLEASWQVRIPPDGPPSFEALRNKIQWSIEVKLEIANFPDDTCTFPLLVLPEVVV